MPHTVLEQLLHYVEVDQCKDSRTVIGFSPTNIRFTVHAQDLQQ